MLNKLKKWFSEHLAKCDKVELEQAVIRLGIGLAILAFLAYRMATLNAFTQNDVIAQKIIIVFLMLSVVLLGLIILSKKSSIFRRLLGAWLDQGSTSLFMLLAGEPGVLLIGIYLWVIFGNGFRFGNLYLFHAQILSLAGFILATQFNSYWQTHMTIVYGMILMLIALPIYVSGLIKRMTEARQKAEDASAAKTRFVANMSHEIRTPLNGIIGIGTLFKTTPLNREQYDLVSTLDSSSKLLLSLLNNVLDFAKIEEGKLSVNSSEFSVSDLFEDTRKIFYPYAESKNVRLETKITANTNLFQGDADLLQQVLANLVGNAVKFTQQGAVTLTASVLSRHDQYYTLRFEVADTGIGIPTSAQGTIFESFTQADISTTRRFGGSGLGLTITKHLVEAMGGRLSFESAEGLGSRFWFDLTLEKSATAPIAIQESTVTPANQHADAASPLHILICEDDATNQKILLRLLELAGHHVSLTSSAEALLDQLEQDRFDVVIADLNMAGMSGTDALKLYRFTRPDDSHTRFILFTADATTEARQAAREAGYDAFLNKPVDAHTLFDTIAKLLDMPAATAENWLNIAMRGATPAQADIDIADLGEVLDINMLMELERLGAGDALFVQRLLRNYLRDSEALLDQIEQAVQLKQYGILRDHCHALKGNSLSIGARNVFKRAETIDRADPGELRFRGSAMVGLLRADFLTAQACIEDYLNRRQSATRY
jgi:two-component system sensor histidine kinase RpfC